MPHCFIPEQNRTIIGRDMGRPIDFGPSLADLKSPSKFATKYVTEQSTNQIRHEETCRPIESRFVAQRNMSEQC